MLINFPYLQGLNPSFLIHYKMNLYYESSCDSKIKLEHFLIYLKVEIRIKHFIANVTTESLDSSMYFYMLVQVRSLSKAEATSCNIAPIWPLISVNSQVIEEVVPFSKMFATIFMVAF